ncbi:hypothetical protein ROA7450_02425 [Roseovarius albus]|uniref:Uncharacterized protein n=1 Tax=Roseovarius albus TaxID=1247867 RepID=A0A1X6ZEU1_9RHOB|nr:hypothetical protein ROA7450_02425 [Roseovarius albus]
MLRTSQLPVHDRIKVEKMLTALWMHEERHVDHGISAAEEVKRYNCENAQEIIDYWVRRSKRYDLETRHGQKEGVKLR